MKRPLIAVALLYIAGILLAALPIPLFSLFAVASGLLLLFIFWRPLRPVLLGALIVLTGWINLAHRTAILSPRDLRTTFGSTENLVTIRGVLRETPYHRVHRINYFDVWTSTAQLQVSEVSLRGDWHPAFGKIITSTGNILPDGFFAGQTVEIEGKLSPASPPVAEGLFDYRSYLDHQGIYYQLRVESPAKWRVLSSPPTPPLADRFCAWARKTLALGLPEEDETLRLEWALTLGWKAALTDEVSEPFIRAATYHIFAVDGLRIAIISGICIGLFRALGIPRALCGFLALPIIWFYAAMTGWPASAIRAIVMIMVVFGGWALKRPGDLLNSLFAAALIILVWEPRQLFQAGFQLSFFVVLCIILILPFFNQLGERLLRPNPLVPESLQPRWKKILRDPARWGLDLFLTSLAAWLGSIPLVAWYFHLITPSSGPANVLAVPLCGLVLICNSASLLFGAWLPSISILFNHAGWFCMKAIQVTSQWSANWPGGYYYVPMPGFFAIGLYYLILISVLTGWLFKGRLRAWKIGALVLLSLIWCGQWLWERPAARLTILPLRNGHAAWLQSANSGEWLIDCGSESSAESVVKLFLRAQGVNRLSNLLLTHGEMDYSGGAQLIFDWFHPAKIYLNSTHSRSRDYLDFEAALKGNPVLQDGLKLGDRAGPWTVLHPDPAVHFPRADDNALVLRGDINGVRVLLCSNLGHLGQNALLSRTNDLRADIVVAGLPVENEPLSNPLLDRIQPRVIIIHDSLEKSAPLKLEIRLEARNIPVLYTRNSRGVTVTARSDGWELSAMDGSTISRSAIKYSRR